MRAAADELGYDYREPGRDFRSVAYWLVLLGAGFTLDLALGGGVAHLPGWLLAAAIIIGLDLLVIHAARSTKSLTLSAEEIRIGDEAIVRAEIESASEGADADAPVLGWLTGMPRGIKAVTLRLSEDRQAVVPTRHPQRLLLALGLGTAEVADEAVTVREAGEDDLPLLEEIDERADTLFRVSGYDVPRLPDDGAANAAAVFVAGRPPVGFVRLEIVDGAAYLAQLAVVPGSMRRGVGTALLERACEWARSTGCSAIFLTTYTDVAWNAPMYARRGWREVADPPAALRTIRDRERRAGLDGVGPRCVMRRDL